MALGDQSPSVANETLDATLVQADEAVSRDDLSEAEAILQKGVAKFPGSALAWTALASVSMARGDHRAAQAQLLSAIELAPGEAELHNLLGAAYHNDADRPMAEHTFKKVLALDGKNLHARMSLAEIARKEGHYEEAARYCREALTEHPDDAGLWVASGRLAVALKEVETAKTAFRHALILEPTHEGARLALERLNRSSGPTTPGPESADEPPVNTYLREVQKVDTDYQRNLKRTFELQDWNPLILWFFRPISIYLTPFFVFAGVSANQVTWTGFALGLLAAGLLSTGVPFLLGVAACVYLTSVILDHVDGNLARYYETTNHYGKFLDGSTGAISLCAFYLGLGMGAYRQCGSGHMAGGDLLCGEPGYLLFAGGVAAAASLASIYMQLRYKHAVAEAQQAGTRSPHPEPAEVSSSRCPRLIAALSRGTRQLLTVTQRSFEVARIPALIVAVYAEALAPYILFCTVCTFVIFASGYISMVREGRTSLDAFRPY
jgi:cytochrome c-type biogenesis protein CcmH/NrfG/phosphatidylglycerophosphate synthase